MKKFLSIVIAAFILFTFCTTVTAHSSSYIYEIDNTTVIFEKDTAFSSQEREQIVETLISGDQDASAYALLCVISGHDYGHGEVVTTITHCVDDKDPRCLEECFIISQCSRCEHYKTERIGGAYISCCPED